ncbi:carboxylate-amine ligase [Yinghuangia seranimata]|uniref:carboxylate-amine ligase n=1 Tax=Yinghuangia seranimata TaxID=408067 RepID=UPI00248C0393|nr:glutamate--cysteine ligase [Yinghuangia seranimata]MDI2124652.1 glutamate--cysteine ligase [Yinghuangia seranimata]
MDDRSGPDGGVAVGVEEEFHIVDAATGLLAPAAPGLLDRLPERTFVREFQQSVVETNSDVHTTLDALRADLVRARRRLAAAAEPLGLAVVAAGSVPLSETGSVDVTAAPRYEHISREYGAVADEQLVCAAQVHVDVPDRDTGVRAMGVLAPWLPVLLALSASSPFWLGTDTGYASWRTLVMQRWPSAGPPGSFASAAEYDALVDALLAGEVIGDRGMVYYDIRPSEHQRTLELRVCDSCPRVDTVVLLAGLFRAMVVDACQAVGTGGAPRVPRQQWLRAATWRAARSGLAGDLLDPVSGHAVPAADLVRALLKRHEPTLQAHGDHDRVTALADTELATGGSASRLRRAAEAGTPLRTLVQRLATETRHPDTPPT